MLTIEGIYKDGKIILTETPADVGESKVLVTFLQIKETNLQQRGIAGGGFKSQIKYNDGRLEQTGNGRLRC